MGRSIEHWGNVIKIRLIYFFRKVIIEQWQTAYFGKVHNNIKAKCVMNIKIRHRIYRKIKKQLQIDQKRLRTDQKHP